MPDHDILTIEEVAAYLRVSERTVYEWAQKGEIPCGKIGTVWRFKRAEIERWVDQRLRSGERVVSPVPTPIRAVLAPERVTMLSCQRKEEALDCLIGILARAPAVRSVDELRAEIIRRETLMSTGIGLGVGVPHVRLGSVTDVVMAMGVAPLPLLDYESLDGEPVRIVCMIAAGIDQHAKYIKTLAAISRRLKTESIRTEILAAKDTTAVYDVMTREDL